MLLSIRINNFKKFKDTGEIPLNRNVVFIGPNNSGKTTALQALTLWQYSINKWLEKRGEKSKARIKSGVAINRKDLLTIPVSSARFLWNDLILKSNKGQSKVTIEIILKGITDDKLWQCGMSFDYFGDEVIYCKPIDFQDNIIITEPEILKSIKIAYLPPMSGLSSREDKLMFASIQARIGQGNTADVLRNLCYYLRYPEYHSQQPEDITPEDNWKYFTQIVKDFFGITLLEPSLNERGEIEMYYRDENGNTLELPVAGRGQQQIMLLLTLLLSNPNTVLLLDEPDAHLEILRQKQVYKLITEIAAEKGSQIIAASHSEIILNEAAERDIVIAFLGKPHQINDKGSQLMKSLTSIGFEQYYQAEQKKWVLYLEGSTDLAILKKFASVLNHPVQKYLETAYVYYVATNIPNKAREHFFGLKEAVPDLKGIAIFDKIDASLQKGDLIELCWEKREIENYFFKPEIIEKYIVGKPTDNLFEASERDKRNRLIKKAIQSIIPPIAMDNPEDEYWYERKASEEMERIFKEYSKLMNIPNIINKGSFWELLNFIEKNEIDKEVIQKLDAILKVSESKGIE